MKYVLLALLLAFSPAKAEEISFNFKPGFGTAITELRYRGFQYLNNSDHGRSLQSAVSFDGRGECYNPTEAGSWRGAEVQDTSKVILKNKFYSLEYMGWWYNPGDSCLNEGLLAKYPKTSVTSDYLLAKKYNIKGNTLDINTTFYSPRDHETATFEALTAYVPSWIFDSIERYDPKDKTSYPYSRMGEDRFPVILYSTFYPVAIGIYSYDLPEYYGPDLVGYGAFKFPESKVNKLNCVFRKTKVRENSSHSFNCKVILGTLKEVRDTISTLEQSK